MSVHSIDKMNNQDVDELWNEDGTQVDKWSLSFAEVVSNPFAFREVVKVKKLSSWNVSAKECLVDMVSIFSYQPTELTVTGKTMFWNRALEKRQKVLSLSESPVHYQNRTEAGRTHRYKAATAFRNKLGSTGTNMEIGKLQSLNISLSFPGILADLINARIFQFQRRSW